MIERYSLTPIKEIWILENQYKRWLKVEIAVILAFEKYKIAPLNTAKNIIKSLLKKHLKDNFFTDSPEFKNINQIVDNTVSDEKLISLIDYIKVDTDRILEIENEVEHDVIAFIKWVGENTDESSRFFHKGLTSSDIVDTSWSLGIKQTGEIILNKLQNFYKCLKDLATRYRYTITIGRTHGVHAEPTTFGLKILGFAAETERNIERLKLSLENISAGKLSGAVGNYANIDPEIEKIALNYLGLKSTKISTQVIPRDLHAEFLNSLALIGAGIERFAIEI